MAERIKTGGRKLSHSEISIFCAQLSLFLRAGVTLLEGLSLLSEDLEHGTLKRIVDSLAESVKERESFENSLVKTGAFPAYLIRMVRIGELSGTLDDTLSSIAGFYEREQALRSRIRSAVSYPLILIVMMSAVILFLIISVLPMFNDIFQSLGGQMSPAVRSIMRFGLFVGDNLFVILITFAMLTALLSLFFRTEAGHSLGDRLKSTLPGFRSVTRKIGAERFATAMSFLLRTDTDMEEAVSLAKDLIGNHYIGHKIEAALALSQNGVSIYDSLYRAGIFPRLFTRMLGVGLKTGAVDEMMTRLSLLYEKEVGDSLKRMTSLIEPILVSVLSLIVGGILVSVMLPLIGIMSQIG